MDEITDRIERFELAWQSSESPDIAAFLPPAEGQCDWYHRRDVLMELIMVELEHRWRGHGTKRASVSRSDDQLLLLEDYARRFPELGPVDRLPLPLIEEEYRARHHWGDKPAIGQYLQRFPDQPLLAGALRDVASQIRPLQIRIYSQRALAWTGPLSGQVELGRQRTGEGGPYTVIHSEGVQRIIIANREQTRISRRHLRLRVETPGKVLATSLTAKGDILIGQVIRLRPHGSLRLKTPCLLTLGEICVRLNLNGCSTYRFGKATRQRFSPTTPGGSQCLAPVTASPWTVLFPLKVTRSVEMVGS